MTAADPDRTKLVALSETDLDDCRGGIATGKKQPGGRVDRRFIAPHTAEEGIGPVGRLQLVALHRDYDSLGSNFG